MKKKRGEEKKKRKRRKEANKGMKTLILYGSMGFYGFGMDDYDLVNSRV